MTRERRLPVLTWMLAVLTAILGGYVYLVEVRGGTRREHAAEAAAHLMPFTPEAATELEIARPGGTDIRCQKIQGRWRITAPIQADADETTLTRLLEDLAQSRIERRLSASAGNSTAYGLSAPIRITVASATERASFVLGKSNPTDEFVFARQVEKPSGVEAGAVLLVDHRVLNATEKTLYDLRDKTVFAFDPAAVTGITFTRGEQRVRLARLPATPEEPQAGWELQAPLRTRADRGKVERMLDLLSNVRAEDFVSERPQDRKRYGLDAPWGSARFDLQNGPAEELLFGRKSETAGLTRYAACQPEGGPIFTINANLPASVQDPPDSWRERHVTDFTRADVTELRLITPQQTVVCAQQEGANGSEWRLAEYNGAVAESMNLGAAAKMPTALRADGDRVEDLLSHLATLEVSGFVAGADPRTARYGLMSPVLKVVARDKQGRTLASVSFGAAQGNEVYAASPHLDSIFRVRAADTAPFRVHAADLAAR